MSRDSPRHTLRGASSSGVTSMARLGAWWMHHRSSAADALLRLSDTPVPTLLTALVVAIAVALPATLLIAFGNVQQLSEHWDARPRLLVYINKNARPDAVDQLIQRLSAEPAVEDIQHISPEQALREFQKESGFGNVLQLLEHNPLPATLVITPSSAALLDNQLPGLEERIRGDGLVDTVDIDLEWVRRLREMMILGKKMVLTLAGLLGLGVLLSIGNTIRLAIENRRDEIIVTKLVGGTNEFVRRPFLYTGAWYGLLGGLIACLLVSAAFASIAPTVRALAAAYQSEYELQQLGIGGMMLILFFSAALGWLGAGVAVGRHLADVEPR